MLKSAFKRCNLRNKSYDLSHSRKRTAEEDNELETFRQWQEDDPQEKLKHRAADRLPDLQTCIYPAQRAHPVVEPAVLSYPMS